MKTTHSYAWHDDVYYRCSNQEPSIIEKWNEKEWEQVALTSDTKLNLSVVLELFGCNLPITKFVNAKDLTSSLLATDYVS